LIKIGNLGGGCFHKLELARDDAKSIGYWLELFMRWVLLVNFCKKTAQNAGQSLFATSATQRGLCFNSKPCLFRKPDIGCNAENE
jgi:hypothetical protein